MAIEKIIQEKKANFIDKIQIGLFLPSNISKTCPNDDSELEYYIKMIGYPLSQENIKDNIYETRTLIELKCGICQYQHEIPLYCDLRDKNWKILSKK